MHNGLLDLCCLVDGTVSALRSRRRWVGGRKEVGQWMEGGRSVADTSVSLDSRHGQGKIGLGGR